MKAAIDVFSIAE